jgi:membrane-bound lytic murein transglycosylase A
MIRRVIVAALTVSMMVIFVGCKQPEKKNYNRALPAGQYALRKLTDPAMFPDFTYGFPANRGPLVAAIDNSLSYLAHPSSQKYFPIQGLTHDQAVDSLQAFRELILAARTPQDLQREIVARFDIYQSIGCDDKGTVLFTGYYTPIFDGSRERTAVYQYPLYKAPPNLVKDAEGKCLGLQQPDGSMRKCPDRAGLENSPLLKGLELVYLKDKYDVHVAQVQGSAKIRLPDGQMMEVGYAATNDYPYTSVGQALVDDKKIKAEDLSLSTIRDYFKAHPDEVDHYIQNDERFIFFREYGGGPYGSLGTPVIPFRSLATDKSIFPRGCLTYVVTVLPWRLNGQPMRYDYKRFMLDQDTGGAIRAPGRADLYIGVGDTAGEAAGWTKNEGQLYYLFLKEMPTAPKM